MAYLEWAPDLDTGIEVIDNQHRQIVNYINQLHEAKTAGDPKAVGQVLEGVIDYTMSHFAFEETLMDDAGYEFSAAHKKTHKAFINRISQFRVRFKAGQDIAEDMADQLSRWLFSHIRHDDAAYVAAVKGKMQRLVSEKQSGGWLARSLKRFFS